MYTGTLLQFHHEIFRIVRLMHLIVTRQLCSWSALKTRDYVADQHNNHSPGHSKGYYCLLFFCDYSCNPLHLLVELKFYFVTAVPIFQVLWFNGNVNLCCHYRFNCILNIYSTECTKFKLRSLSKILQTLQNFIKLSKWW